MEKFALEGEFAAISPERRTILDALCIPLATQAERAADDERWENLFTQKSKGLSPKAANKLFHEMFTSAYEPDPPSIFVQEPNTSSQPQNPLEHAYVDWRRGMLERKKSEELAAKVPVEKLIPTNVRFVIPEDCTWVKDLHTGETYTNLLLITQCALTVMLNFCVGKANWKSGPEICKRACKQHNKIKEIGAKYDRVIDMFRYTPAGAKSKVKYPFYEDLIEGGEREGLYWIDPAKVQRHR